MPLQPSRRDTASLPAVVRHHQSYLRSLNPGMGDGRWATPQPVGGGPSPLVGGEEGGSDESPAVIGEDGDRLTLTHLRDQVWPLQYDPISETIHVHFHRRGGAGLEWKRGEHYEIDDDSNVIVIRAATLAAAKAQVGDVFSAQYLRLDIDDGPDEIDLSVIGYTAPGTWDDPTKTLTYDLPVGTTEGDLLILSVRGNVAPGGGEVIDAVSCSDPRLELAFTATRLNGSDVVVESIWIGTATASVSPVVVDVTQDPSFVAWGAGVLAALHGANGWGASNVVEIGTTTPVVAGVAAVAVTWLHANPITQAAAPSGFTEIGASPSGYSSTDISYWYDLNGTASPTGTFPAGYDGCLVIAIV